MIGHCVLTVGESTLSGELNAADRWKLLQPRVVEGVGWVIWHLRRDLCKSAKNILLQKANRSSVERM